MTQQDADIQVTRAEIERFFRTVPRGLSPETLGPQPAKGWAGLRFRFDDQDYPITVVPDSSLPAPCEVRANGCVVYSGDFDELAIFEALAEACP